MASLNDRLKAIFIRDGIISSEDLSRALDEQAKTGEELGKILLKMKLVDEDTLRQVLSEGLGIPIIKVSCVKLDSSIIKIIPSKVCRNYQLVPISLIGEHLTVAMADPLNIFAIDNLKALTGYSIIPVISSPKEIEAVLDSYYKQEQASDEKTETFDEIMQDIRDTEDLELVKDIDSSQSQEIVEELTEEAPIIKLADTIIKQAVMAGASDVFIEPLEKSMRIRYRVDGVIREIDRMAKVLLSPLISRFKVISNLDISEHRIPQDGRFKMIISGDHEVDFRVNVLPTVLGEKIVLRVLDQDSSVLNIDKLGFEPESMKRLKECVVKPHGMILTCGPTGSGKTTTLYSILKFVDSPEKNIVTVEDPVEYEMPGLNQVNIKSSMGLTFPVCLRSILRQDPDIIMIGEIRDSETLDIAVKAALTGHLVLSSLHTTTAAGSVIRMMNMGIEPFLICSSVLAIVAQRLLRRICPKCKELYNVPEDIAKRIGIAQYLKEGDIQFYKGRGCDECFNTGYKGRVGITEICVLSARIKEYILQRAGEFEIKQVARAEGMKTMREDGLAKAAKGLTTLEEVLRVTAPDDPLHRVEG